MSRFTSYSETLDYMFSQLPMFHNIGKAAYKADLNNTIALLEAIGNPHRDQKWIHVAGTNGKGSVSSMLAAMHLFCPMESKHSQIELPRNSILVRFSSILQWETITRREFRIAQLQPCIILSITMRVWGSFWRSTQAGWDV